jgi:hypothetical protein
LFEKLIVPSIKNVQLDRAGKDVRKRNPEEAGEELHWKRRRLPDRISRMVID